MAAQLNIAVRSLGSAQPLIPDWYIHLPSGFPKQGEPLTLRDLLTLVVQRELEAAKKANAQKKLFRLLTEQQLEEGIQTGKVAMPKAKAVEVPNEDAAVAAVLQSFEDGLFIVVMDGEERKHLDEEVFLRVDTSLIFIRLAMLSGKLF